MALVDELRHALPSGRVTDRLIDRVAFANDASVYRLVPRVVVMPADLDEVRALLAVSRRHRIPLTFRAAGTSLSGQAITDGILAVLSRHWTGCEVLDRGARVRVQPGVIGGDVNRRLRPYGAKLGPDPASIQSCMMGGILANNSSGMCCGVARNAYHTLETIRVALPDGTLVDGADERADEMLRRARPELHAGLHGLRERVLADGALFAAIRRKYAMKNTMGYSLNAFTDFERPVDILSHLMIGSEGTLGFIAEAVLRTVPDHPAAATGLLLFPDVPAACGAIEPLRRSGAVALELMDGASLRAVRDRPGMPRGLAELPPEAAALLIEYQCPDRATLDAAVVRFRAARPALPLLAEPELTEDPDRRARLWTVRKGLIPSVGALRSRGTSFIIEDVVFPVDRLADGVAQLQASFRRHGYDDAIVFGHAKDGNLHFVLTQSFDRSADVERYDAFMRELAELVAVRFGGALKAEHGTGRNMAPFVAAEWGEAAWSLMRDVKRLFDPDGLLNPGVVVNDDPRAHVRDLKSLPRVENEVDRCIECGFCERMCPSRELTLTPRQRIVVRRELARLRSEGDESGFRELARDWTHAGLDTCAADGLCATACPVDIDTGALVTRLRAERTSPLVAELAAVAAGRFGVVESGARAALRSLALARRLVGTRAAARLVAPGARLAGLDGGLLVAELPAPAQPPTGPRPLTDATAVLAPSCVSRILGPVRGDPDAPTALAVVAARAGERLRVAPTAGRCCGLAFASKGLLAAADRAAADLVRDALEWTGRGRVALVVETSPCASELARRAAGTELRVVDAVRFVRERVVPRLAPRRRAGRVVVHPVCSVRRAGLERELREVVERYGGDVVVPFSAGCCGFAGDRGFREPALTAAALRREALEIDSAPPADACVATSRTCELGLTRATGRTWRSLWALVEEATR